MGFKLTTLVVIGTDCTGSCKSNNHTITTTMAPVYLFFVFLCIVCPMLPLSVLDWFSLTFIHKHIATIRIWNKILHQWLQNAWNHLLFEQSREWLHIYTFNIYRCKFKYRE
jgi:hypothetical protein